MAEPEFAEMYPEEVDILLKDVEDINEGMEQWDGDRWNKVEPYKCRRQFDEENDYPIRYRAVVHIKRYTYKKENPSYKPITVNSSDAKVLRHLENAKKLCSEGLAECAISSIDQAINIYNKKL